MAATKTVPTGKGPVNFATVGRVIKPAAMQPARLTTLVNKIDTKTVAGAAASLREVKLRPAQVAPVMAHIFKASPDNALKLSKAVLEHAKSDQGDEGHARALFQWAQGPKQRQMVCTAFRQQKLGAVAIHQIGELTQKDAQSYMKDYFESGGTINAVLQWMEIAGSVLNENLAGKHEGTAGSVVKWVGNQFKKVAGKVVDAVSGMVHTVSDAIKAAGKSLAHVVEQVVSWTADRVRDVVRALVAAGKTVAGLLAEAVKHGLAALDKFVHALLAAGRSILSVLDWAANQALNVVKTAVNAMLAAGLKVAAVLTEAVKLAAKALQQVVQALYQLGKKAGEILSSVASTAVSIIHTVLQGLFQIGVQLADAVVAICQNVLEGFRKGFFQGLIALGKTPLEIVKAAAKGAGAVVGLALAVIMEVFGGHRPLNDAEIKEARKIFGWSIPLERVKLAVASVPADLVNWINGNRAFTTMYVINFASWFDIDKNMHSLIHELTHVWQATTSGPVYMVEALDSQLFGRGYNVTDADLARANGNFNKLEREQQAVVVEYYWWGRYGGAGFDWKKYEPLAKAVYRPAAGRAPAPLRAAAAAGHR
ncbi:MAG TPA: hypothetical protein VNW97_02505 [Candidatus Saccharimonadales bacterium]|jgi:hypothetical protein|nr:hypothetical protein [Candidatus Saccharimonadales bacterium]